MPVQNPTHGEFAKQAVEQFAYNNGSEDNSFEENAVDLLADLILLCDVEAADFSYILAQATAHAENESEA
jgi:hypothetical protein